MKLTHFNVQLSLRLVLLFLGLTLLAFGLANDIRISLIILLVVFIAAQVYSVIRYR